MATTAEGVALKNGGRGATRGSKGQVTAQNRGRYGHDFSIAVKDETAPSKQRVLYMSVEDAYDLADVLDALLEAVEEKAGV